LVWIGTGGGGLNCLDKLDNTFTHYQHDENDPTSISGNDIWAISQDARGDLWIGTHEAGFNKFNSAQQTFSRFQHDPNNSNTVAGNAIYDLVVDKKRDVLWIASYLSGLDKYDIEKGSFTHYAYDANNQSGIISNWSTSVTVDSKGMVWIGTEAGLSRFDPDTERFSNFLHDKNRPNSLSSNMIQTIFEDSNKVVWVGTSNGINKFDEDGTFTRFSENDGLVGNYVAAILEGKEGHLWISTDKGISDFNPQDNSFRNYSVNDGLQGDRFLMNSAFSNSSGELFFGGENGFNVFNPAELTKNLNIPEVVLTNFTVFNQPVQVGKDSPLQQHINVSEQIVLEHDQSVFGLEFVALNYRNSKKNQYAYMLDGFDKGYVRVDGDHRYITYTNLDPGSYTFRVKASNNSGVWNEEGNSIEILVLAPWWETFWFRGTLLVVVAGIIVGGVFFRIHSIQKINRQLEAQVADRTRELKAWLEHSPVCTKVVDLDFNLQYMSSAGIQVFEIDNISSFYGKPYPFDFFPDSYKKCMREYLKKVRETGEVISYEAPVFDVSGNELWFEATLLPVKDDQGKIENIIVISVNTTDRNRADIALRKAHDDLEKKVQERTIELTREIADHKESEKQKSELEAQLRQSHKLEAIGSLAGGIAHDFNNILGVILGNAELALEDAPAGTEVEKGLDHVIKASLRAKDLVKQILSFSRQTQLEHIPLKMQPLLKEGVKMLRSSTPSMIKITEDIDPTCGTVLADSSQVQQIVMNLCTNAIQAMGSSNGELSVSLRTTYIDFEEKRIVDLDQGEYVVLTISDTGTGIGPDVINRIFDPFFTTKGVGKGTGMGLSIVHGIMKEFGGTITVESQLGTGSTFRSYFPALNKEPLSEKEEPQDFPKGNERILFVDDEKSISELGKSMLERLGYKVTAESNSMQALGVFQNTPDEFDLVISDQTMPGMTGIDLASRILQTRSDIPIILCTGYNNLLEEDSVKSIGVKEIVMKPLSFVQIAKLVRRVLDTS